MDASSPTLSKVVGCIVRRPGARSAWELLVFEHPLAGCTHLVKGTVEDDEPHAVAIRRELEEESGITAVRTLVALDEIPIAPGQNPDPLPSRRVHLYYPFLVEPDVSLPPRWDHIAVGSAEEEGLTFSFRWIDLDGGEADALHPAFRRCVVAARETLGQTDGMGS